ncbi:MAG: hypothetical protein KJP16_01980, partial [Gammaproteobacteria bacterium]|nr:hypothetical protein [Gammaproteobacteria bacterium]
MDRIAAVYVTCDILRRVEQPEEQRSPVSERRHKISTIMAFRADGPDATIASDEPKSERSLG